MKRDKNLPLTETTFYILLALRQAGHGYVVMQRVEELSGGAMRIAAGTMYGALEILMNKELIYEVYTSDVRRKTYIISDYGKKVLNADCERMKHMLGVINK